MKFTKEFIKKKKEKPDGTVEFIVTQKLTVSTIEGIHQAEEDKYEKSAGIKADKGTKTEDTGFDFLKCNMKDKVSPHVKNMDAFDYANCILPSESCDPE